MENKMKTNYAERNNVESKNQLDASRYVTKSGQDNNALRVLFFGNSITLHAPKPEIGWNGNWGMAASRKENDYVHRVVQGLEERFGQVNYCIAQGAAWERDYPNGKEILERYFKDAQDFQANVVVIRIGENIPNSTLQEIDCKPYFREAIRFFASNPTAKVVVTDNFWRKEIVDNALQEVAKEEGYLFCQLHDLQDDEKTMAIGQFEHEGVSIHPGDYGMECIAKRILKTLDD